MPDRHTQPLNYATPHSGGRRRVTLDQQVAGFYSVVAAIIASLAMLDGVANLFQAFGTTDHGTRNEGLLFSALGFGIGGVCAALALRLGKQWFQQFDGR